MACIIISTSYNPSVVSKYFRALAHELSQRGHKVIVLVDNQKSHKVNTSSNPAILTWPSKRPVFLKDAIFLHNLIIKFRPDCIIGNFSANNICLIVGWINGTRHRWVWNHTLSSQIPPSWKKSILQFRKQYVMRLATNVIGNSIASIMDVQQLYKLSPEKASLVLPILMADPNIREDKIDHHRIICVGRLVNVKGQETLIRAIPLFLEKDEKIMVDFVGDGVDRNAFEYLAHSLGVADHCHFIGNVLPEEVLARMASAALCVVPSYSEAFGIVNIEALSVGTPLVASDVGGIRDVVVNGQTGFLVPPGDVDALAGRIIEILDNPGLRSLMSEKARIRFLNNYSFMSLPGQVDKLEAILCG